MNVVIKGQKLPFADTHSPTFEKLCTSGEIAISAMTVAEPMKKSHISITELHEAVPKSARPVYPRLTGG